MNWIKHRVRNFSIWLNCRTRRWVVPSKTWDLIENDNLVQADYEIAQLEKKWYLDPEVVRVRLVYRRASYKSIEAHTKKCSLGGET